MTVEDEGSVQGGVPPKRKRVSVEDKTLIEELLKAGVSLTRVSELFLGRVGERELNAVARGVVVASAAALDDDGDSDLAPAPANGCAGSRVLPERLGMCVLERSKSAARDVSFVRGHAANLATDAPEELLDPLFFTIMRDPVVLSSGYVVDRSTALDERGDLKFHACPFTRAPLRAEVYPLVCRRRLLQEYKERKVRNMSVTARALLDERNLGQFREVMEAAERFLDDLGDRTYVHLALGLAKLALEAHDLDGPEAARPAQLARIYIRMYRASPQLKNRGKEGENTKGEGEGDEVLAFQARVNDLSVRAAASVEDGRLDEALEWIQACEEVHASCPGTDVLPTGALRLALAKARGDGDLSGPRRRVYEEIRSDPDAVARFCEEEGIGPDDLRDMRPVLLVRASVDDYSRDYEWHRAIRSDPLEYEVAAVMVKAGTFRDQDWGNTKGRLGLALYNADGELVVRCNLFGTYRTPHYSYGDHPARVLRRDEEVVSMARPGFTYALEYTVGGGGGHSLHVKCWFCKIFPVAVAAAEEFVCPFSCRVKDPEGDEGLFVGPVDMHGKAHGRGELYYDDGGGVGDIFVGNFSHGSLDRGVLYSGTEAKYSMEQGRWNVIINSSVVEEFPHESAISANLTVGDEDGYTYGSDGNDPEPHVGLMVRNTTSFAVNVFWIDETTGEEDCLDFENPLPAGGTDWIGTHPRHRFVAYNEDRSFQREFAISEGYGGEETFCIEE